METAGSSGNFSAATNDLSADRLSNETARGDPQGSGSRSRGLTTPSFTREYFSTQVAFDSYNTSTVTVNRGPNAALFGVGSAAGVVNTALAQAELGRDSNRVTVRFGNNGASRETLDMNRVLLPKKAAVRLSFLQDNEKFNQRPAYQNKSRAYGALTVKPFWNTTIRGNFETGNTHANRPITLLPNNDISSQWMAAGRPGYDWTIYDDPAKNPAAASIAAGPTTTEGNLIGTVNVFGPLIVYTNPNDKQPTTGFAFRNLTTATFAANAIASQIIHPIVNRDQATDTIQFIHTRNVWDLPAAYWVGSNVPAGQQPGYVPVGMKLQSFTDYSAFDWRNRLIDQSSHQDDSFHTSNISLAQTAWQNRIGLEIAYDRQRLDRVVRDGFFGNSNANRIMVDVNAFLPTGERNPNYGRPFAAAAVLVFSNFSQATESQRATAFLKYDFMEVSKTWGRWAGKHTLTGLLERDASKTLSYTNRLQAAGAASEAADPGNIFGSNRRPTFIAYLGPTIIGNNNPLTLNPIQIPELRSGPTVPVTYFVRAANQTDPGHFEAAATSLADVNAGGSAQREVVQSKAVVLQSHWIKDSIITMLSWRRDEDYFARQTLGFVANPNDRNDPGKTFYGLNDFAFARTPPPSVAKEITSYGAVLQWPKKLVKLPSGMDLSVFYNQSSNFTPLGGRLNQFAEPLAPPVGKTKEWGFNLLAGDGKLNLRVNRFETSVQGISAAPTFFSALKGAILNVGLLWATEGNVNPQLAAKSNADLELLFSPLPSNYRQMYNFIVSGSPPNVAASNNAVAFSSTDTVDSSASGWEADLTWSPTRNWRFLFNVAKQETIQTNAYPFSKRLIALMKPVWDQLSSRPAGNYPAGYQIGTPLPTNAQTYGQYLDLNVYVPFASAIATEGSVSAEQRKWRGNLVSNYSFDRQSPLGEWLTGFGFGAAVRWQDKLGIGYPSSRDPNGTAHFDIKHPFYVAPQTNADAWVSYTRRILNNKVTWKAQLNVSNIIGQNGLIAVTAQSWNGTVGQYRLPPERRWYLTNSFGF